MIKMKIKRNLSAMALCFCCLLSCSGCSPAPPKETAAKQTEAKETKGKNKKTDIPAADRDSSGSDGNTDLVTMIPADPEEDKSPSGNKGPDIDSQIAEYLEKMTLEEKAAQLFIVLPESITGTSAVTEAGPMTEEAIQNTPVGGLVYMEQNLQYPEQVKEMLSTVQKYSMERISLPLFTCVDEEGGSVARINGNPSFGVPSIGNMSDIGGSGDTEAAYSAGLEIGTYLSELGFNVDFAPVADVLSSPDNEVVRERSFGSNPDQVAEMSAGVLKGLREKGVFSAFKHYPGHGATEGDTHDGYAYTSKSLDDLLTCELIPFERGIQEDVDFIMAGHISLPNVIGDNTPASLSYKMLSEILRDQMDYNGIIITDAMNMGAITQNYSSADAAVKSIQAGADMVLMPEDFNSAYQGVLNAVHSQIIPADRIDDSVARILRLKLSMSQ